ncbi:MAG: hypothetical protein IJY58_01525 [Alphaproteobacteria bacterium]|nr:hypothetical protein [Alphaproteobacteria bacterium]
MTQDVGGSIAVAGFNYQKAVIALIAILNYNKDNLRLYMEDKEDIVVFLGEEPTFIQVKGTKLSLSKLAEKTKQKKSIIAKNLQKSNHSNARFKIATLDSFCNISKDLEKTSKNKIFYDGVFEYKQASKNFLIEKLLTEDLFSENELSSKLDRSYIFITPFSKSLSIAQTYLLGEMTKNSICVDNHQGIIALNELCNQIDLRSEIVLGNDEELNQKKSFTSLDLKKIFFSQNRSDMFKKILSEVREMFSFVESEKIERERLKILSCYKSIKDKVLPSVKKEDIINADIQKLIKSVYEINKSLGNKEMLYAVIIDCIADRIEEVLSE